MKKIMLIARKVVLFTFIAALLWLVVQFVQAPITTISKLFNPFDRMEGRVPHEAANAQGRVEFLLGEEGKGVRMSIPSIYVGSKVQDEMELVWLLFNYETLEPLGVDELNARKAVTAIIHPSSYRDASTRSDFEILQENEMLSRVTKNLWRVSLPKGRKEINEWEEKYKLRHKFFPVRGGYYYIINGNAEISRVACERKCSMIVNVSDHLYAEFIVHKDELENLPHITHQVKKVISAAIVEAVPDSNAN